MTSYRLLIVTTGLSLPFLQCSDLSQTERWTDNTGLAKLCTKVHWPQKPTQQYEKTAQTELNKRRNMDPSVIQLPGSHKATDKLQMGWKKAKVQSMPRISTQKICIILRYLTAKCHKLIRQHFISICTAVFSKV